MSDRLRLPNRRPSVDQVIRLDGSDYLMTVGFHPATGQVSELFLNGTKPGSVMDSIMGDAAVIVSIALQNGIRLSDMAKTVGRQATTPPKPSEIDHAPTLTVAATPIGAALDAAIEIENWSQGL